MTKYREILRLKHLGFSERNIARTAGVSRNKVKRVVEAATAAKIDWTHAESMVDATIEKALFPDRKAAQPSHSIDFEYIRKELLRNGVTKKLLWAEYCESCRLCNREPLMYSQFCHYIQQEEQKRRATMHIPRRPAETVEVDWAGDPAHVIDPDTGDGPSLRNKTISNIQLVFQIFPSIRIGVPIQDYAILWKTVVVSMQGHTPYFR